MASRCGTRTARPAIPFPVVAVSPPRVSDVALAASVVPLALRVRLGVTARAGDDCRLARATVEMHAGRGCRRAGKPRDDGKDGDAVAGDGISAGWAAIRAAVPATVRVRVVVRNAARTVVTSTPLPLVVPP